MSWSHALITRPAEEGAELARQLETRSLVPIVLPPFSFSGVTPDAAAVASLAQSAQRSPQPILVFVSTRAVEFGVASLPRELLQQCRLAAVGSATADALRNRGLQTVITPRTGSSSEDLLQELSRYRDGAAVPDVGIVAAPGGRRKMQQSLSDAGHRVVRLDVYRRDPAPLDHGILDLLLEAKGLIAVWTSANAMKSLSQRLPPAVWFKVCSADWLVVSERLRRLARAYGPASILLAGGPSNTDIVSAVAGGFR